MTVPAGSDDVKPDGLGAQLAEGEAQRRTDVARAAGDEDALPAELGGPGRVVAPQRFGGGSRGGQLEPDSI